MGRNRWGGWDRWMRALHLYTGLFLAPWMMVYAVSAFCLNHSEWFTEGLELAQNWEDLSDEEFIPGPGFPETPEEQAVAILKEVNLEGPHRILGEPNENQLVIFRFRATGPYRVSWLRASSRVVVARFLPASLYSVINSLHFQHGYRPYFAHVTWALIVDATTTSTVIWVISGIYLWARRRRKRLLGGVCLIGGILLFVLLAILLCY